jgi:hypothetical protein
MMNEVNELWTSAWRQLQKHLASSFVAGGAGARDSLFATPVQGRALPASSWLMRARSGKPPTARIVQQTI